MITCVVNYVPKPSVLKVVPWLKRSMSTRNDLHLLNEFMRCFADPGELEIELFSHLASSELGYYIQSESDICAEHNIVQPFYHLTGQIEDDCIVCLKSTFDRMLHLIALSLCFESD